MTGLLAAIPWPVWVLAVWLVAIPAAALFIGGRLHRLHRPHPRPYGRPAGPDDIDTMPGHPETVRRLDDPTERAFRALIRQAAPLPDWREERR